MSDLVGEIDFYDYTAEDSPLSRKSLFSFPSGFSFLKLPMTSLTEDMMAKELGYRRMIFDKAVTWLLLMTQIRMFFSLPEYIPLAGIRVQE